MTSEEQMADDQCKHQASDRKRIVVEWGVQFSTGDVFATGSMESALDLASEGQTPVARTVVHYKSDYGDWQPIGETAT